MSEGGVDVVLEWSEGMTRWCGCDIEVVRRCENVVWM